ncbi:MAG: hypothetical protein KKB30_04370 [Proteobacteria bacterium]|nr:hypothetical protein [Pseudomonadota bacterium]MBU1716463.1 hypothetical protein [Pseudomonadota bacterium]
MKLKKLKPKLIITQKVEISYHNPALSINQMARTATYGAFTKSASKDKKPRQTTRSKPEKS